MAHYYLQKGFEPNKIINLPTRKKNFYIASMELEIERELEVLKWLKKTISRKIEIKDAYSSELSKFKKNLKENSSGLENLKSKTDESTESLAKIAKVQKASDEYWKKNTSSLKKLRKETTDNVKPLSKLKDELDNNEKAGKKADKSFKSLGDTLSDSFKTGGIKGVVGELGGMIAKVAIVKESLEAIGKGVGFSINEQSDRAEATSKLKMATGMSATDTAKYNSSISSVYRAGYGDDRKDVANTMALIKQQIGDIDPEKMSSFAKNIYAINKAFDIDANESIRGINAMMKQFKITSEEATNLLIQGSQEGLNQNGDLFDQMAEYSTYWSELGFSAEDAMNMLKAGADTGAFQIDKVNDAIKELRNRSKDGSGDDYFKMLGFDSKTVKANLSSGGDKGKNQTLEILNRLSRVTDKTQQFVIGQGLMGTQWEDVGSKSILALTQFNDEINNTKDAVAELQSDQFAGLKGKFHLIGRNLSEALEPLESLITPSLEKFANWLENSFAPAVEKFSKWFASDSISSKKIKTGAKIGIETGVKSLLPPGMSTVYDTVKNMFKVDGNKSGRKAGIGRVPYDNYYTFLHEGETVLTKRESEEITHKNSNSGSGNSIAIAKLADQIIIREESDIDKITSKLVQKLINSRAVMP